MNARRVSGILTIELLSFFLCCLGGPGSTSSSPTSGPIAVAPARKTGIETDKIEQELRSRVHRSWDGEYRYASYRVDSVEGQKNDILVVVYEAEGHDASKGLHMGNLIDIAELSPDGETRFLQESLGTRPRGVTPSFEGIDVFPGQSDAEVIVRWNEQGNGGWRTVEKYLYRPGRLVLAARAEFTGKSEFRWRSAPESE